MKRIINKIKQLKTLALKNTNTQNIARKIINWLDKLNPIGNAGSPREIKHIWRGTQEQYDAIQDKRDDVLYIVSNSTLGIASNLGGIAFGEINSFPKATALAAVAISNAAEANGPASFAVGNGAIADGSYSYALGPSAHTIGQAAFATGLRAEADLEAIALGTDALASGYWSEALGKNSIASGSNAHASQGGEATQLFSRAIGPGAKALNRKVSAFSNSTINQKGDSQREEYIMSDSFSTNVQEAIGYITTETGDLYDMTIRVMGIAPSTGEKAVYNINTIIHNTSSSGVTHVTFNKTVVYEDIISWDVATVATGADLNIEVTGEDGKEIYWMARIEAIKIKTQ